MDDTSVGRVGPPLPCCYIKVLHVVSVRKDAFFRIEKYNLFLDLGLCQLEFVPLSKN